MKVDEGSYHLLQFTSSLICFWGVYTFSLVSGRGGEEEEVDGIIMKIDIKNSGTEESK